MYRGTRESIQPSTKRPLSIVPRRPRRIVTHVKMFAHTAEPQHRPCTPTLRARLSMMVSVDECAVAMLVVHGCSTESPTATVTSDATSRGRSADASRNRAECGNRPGFHNSVPLSVPWRFNFVTALTENLVREIRVYKSSFSGLVSDCDRASRLKSPKSRWKTWDLRD